MPRLLETLRRSDASPEAVRAALISLASLAADYPLALSPVISLLEKKEASPHAAAIIAALGEAGCQRALPAMLKHTASADAETANAARAAAARLMPQAEPAAVQEIFLQAGMPEVAALAAASLAARWPAARVLALSQKATANARLGALKALRTRRAAETAAFLADADPAIALEAALSIHDEPIVAARRALGGLLENPPPLPPDSPAWPRAIVACWEEGQPGDALRLAAWLQRPEKTPSLSTLALEALLSWDAPPAADPVTDRPLQPLSRPAASAWAALATLDPALWPECDEALRRRFQQWSSAISVLPADAEKLTAFLADTAQPEGVRLFHYERWLQSRGQAPEAAEVSAAALQVADAPRLRAAARAFLFRRQGAEAIPWLLHSLSQATAREKQAAMRLIGQHKSAETDGYLLRLLGQARLRQVDPAVVPELLEAIERRTRHEGPETRAFREALDAYRAAIYPSVGDALRPWRPALQEGDAEAGRALLFASFTRCAECHRLSATDAARPAPDLMGIHSTRSAEALLARLVQPAAVQKTDAPAESPRCLPLGTLLSLRELRDLLTALRAL